MGVGRDSVPACVDESPGCVHAGGRAARVPYYSLVNVKSRFLFWPLLMEKEVATHSIPLPGKSHERRGLVGP